MNGHPRDSLGIITVHQWPLLVMAGYAMLGRGTSRLIQKFLSLS
jgi:hypothetical protein